MILLVQGAAAAAAGRVGVWKNTLRLRVHTRARRKGCIMGRAGCGIYSSNVGGQARVWSELGMEVGLLAV